MDREITLTFRGRTDQQINEIATKLKSRALEMGGFVGITHSPDGSQGKLIAPLEPLPGEDEAAYSARKAALAAKAREARRIIGDAETPVESPLAKFNRVFDATE